MSQAKIILLADIPSLGKLGDIVSVKAGFARNWLLPRQLAIRHSKQAYAGFAERKAEILKRQAEERDRMQKLRDRLDGYILQVTVASGAEGQLYGSLNQARIAEQLRLQGYEVVAEQVRLPEDATPVRQIGEYDLTVAIATGLSAAVKLSVLSESVSGKERK